MSGTNIVPGSAIDLPIKVVAKSAQSPGEMVLPVLHKLQAMLELLIETGWSSSIDLRRTPLAPEDHETLDPALGRGEVSATTGSLRPTRIQETTVTGIWKMSNLFPDSVAAVVESARAGTGRHERRPLA